MTQPIDPQIIEAGNALIQAGQARGSAQQIELLAKALVTQLDKVTNETRAAILGSKELNDDQKNQTVDFVGLAFSKLRALTKEWEAASGALKAQAAQLDQQASAATSRLNQSVQRPKLLRAVEAAWRELSE